MKPICTLRNLFLFCSYLLPSFAFATHNRAGEIQVEYVDDLTRRATIITYTKASSIPADRSVLTIIWGDGTTETVARSNGKGEFMGNDIKKNTYSFTHKYANYGTYEISMADPNRNGGILNVNFPQSDAVQFYIKTVIIVSKTLKNSTPRLLQAPIDRGRIGTPFKHIVNAFDADDDSIAYRMAVPLQDRNSPVPLYEFPDKIKPGTNNKISLNEQTGELVWDSPQQRGEYNIAIHVISYRNGVAIDTTVRDMQILIEPSTGPLPEIASELPQQIEAKSGDEIVLIVKSKKVGTNQYKISATGGSFELINSKSIFGNRSVYQGEAADTFRWKIVESHSRKTPYNIVFKIEDNSFDSMGVVNFYRTEVKVKASALSTQNIDNQLIKAYPNPSNSFITFEMGEKMDGETIALEVFDVAGKNVFSTKIKNPNAFILNKETVGTGLFMVKIAYEKAGKVAVKKVVFE